MQRTIATAGTSPVPIASHQLCSSRRHGREKPVELMQKLHRQRLQRDREDDGSRDQFSSSEFRSFSVLLTFVVSSSAINTGGTPTVAIR